MLSKKPSSMGGPRQKDMKFEMDLPKISKQRILRPFFCLNPEFKLRDIKMLLLKILYFVVLSRLRHKLTTNFIKISSKKQEN